MRWAGNTGSQNFRLLPSIKPTHYEYTLRLDPKKNTFEGSGTVAIRATEPTSTLTLHALDLEIGSASVLMGNESIGITSMRYNAKSETVTFELAKPVAGEVSLGLAWKGKVIEEGLRGLYWGDKGVLVTHFEPADARRVFPTFDEPAFKATWGLTLEAPKDYVVHANGAAIKAEKLDDGTVRTSFAKTGPQATYVVAFSAGRNLVGSRVARAGHVPIRTWTTKPRQHLMSWAQTVARESLQRLERYAGIPYPYGKVDELGVSEMGAGAMENIAHVLYDATQLLDDRKEAPLEDLQSIADTITHELAHQWFGNLVTMEWWNDLWLNESFATWQSTKILHQWKPEWRMWAKFNQDREHAFELDALSSTHPIHAVVLSHAHIAKFDSITYEKGAALIRMIEAYVGEENFRRGLQNYLQKHANGNAVADDLWAAIQEASDVPVLHIANEWINRAGHPLVEVAREGNGVVLRQSRFFTEPGKTAPGVWPIPLVLRYEDESGRIHEKRIVFDKAKTKVGFGGARIKWVTANADASGFYRVAYHEDLRKELHENLAKLRPSERFGLLSDTWALVRSGRRNAQDWLNLATSLKDETDPEVLDEIKDGFVSLSARGVSDEVRPAFRKAVARLFAPRLEKVGWEKAGPRAKSDHETQAARELREHLLILVGDLGRDPRWVDGATDRVRRFLTGDKKALSYTLLPAAVAIASKTGDDELFKLYLKHYRSEASPRLTQLLLYATANFELPRLGRRSERLLFDRRIPLDEEGEFFESLLLNPTTRDEAWKWLRQTWRPLKKHLKDAPTVMEKVIESLEELRTKEALEQARTLLTQDPPKDMGDMVRQTLERIRRNLEYRERVQPHILAWMKGLGEDN